MSNEFQKDFDFLNKVTGDFLETNFIEDNCYECERFKSTLESLMFDGGYPLEDSDCCPMHMDLINVAFHDKGNLEKRTIQLVGVQPDGSLPLNPFCFIPLGQIAPPLEEYEYNPNQLKLEL